MIRNVVLYMNGEGMKPFTGKDPVTGKEEGEKLKKLAVPIVPHTNWIGDEWEMETETGQKLPLPYPRTGEAWICNLMVFKKQAVALPVTMWRPARSYDVQS